MVSMTDPYSRILDFLDRLSSHLLSKNVKVEIYRSIILPVVWCRCGIWFPTLRYEHGLRVFENRVLRGLFGPKTD
jgi:hypothetical protein